MGQIEAITWTDIVTAIAAASTAVILIFAAIYTFLQLRSMERSRAGQLLADLSRRWIEEPLAESRRAVKTYKNGYELWEALEYLEKKNHEQYYILVKVADFYEDLAILVNERCLRLKQVEDMFGPTIKHYYDLYTITIDRLREKHKTESIYENFEDLARKAHK